VALVPSYFASQRDLERSEGQRLDASLLRRARTLDAVLRETVLPGDGEARVTRPLHSWVAKASRIADARVTLIAADGTVVADSVVPPEALHEVENHGSRAEVLAARHAEFGVSTRNSQTLKRTFRYLALRPPSPDALMVRLAADPLEGLGSATQALRRSFLRAAGIALVAALLLGLAVGYWIEAPVRDLRDAVQRVADGEPGHRPALESEPALQQIAATVYRLAEELRGRVDDARSERDRLGAVLGSMAEGVLVLDEQGRLAMANPRLRELLSISGSIEGKRSLEVTRHAEIDAILREASAQRAPVVREVELEGASARQLRVYAVSIPREGKKPDVVAVFHDVTEIRRLENVRRDFISNASHELRTPLTSIRGFAETLLGADLSAEELRPYLESIARNSTRLGRLVDDLLELSRIESLKVPLRPSPVDLVELCETLIIDLEPRFAEAKVDATCSGSGPVLAWADRRAVEQIVTNLLHNAIQYTDPGGQVSIRVCSQGTFAHVEIEDTGIGIPTESQDRIFERFYRVDAGRSRALGGTGLGLAIVKHLVQAMGGDIHVASEVGKGSCFRFKLPIPSPA